MDKLPLYWSDPDMNASTATVLNAEPSENGWKLVLDRQLFYPGGGGQSADRGSIEGCPITAIRKIDDVIQVEISCSRAITPGDNVECVLDASFRKDSRQQHSGQHLLSSALSLEGLDTVSVHLGSDYTGIEVSGFSGDTISEATINKVLDTCDQWISECRSINSLYLKPEELDGMELRRSLSDKAGKAAAAPVRIVEIEGLDRVGCGGVHLNNTGAIGLILFAGWEKMRGNIRLNWLIGDRAVVQARFHNRQGQVIGSLFSAGPGEIIDRIESMLEENRKSRLSLKKSEKEIGRLRAMSWIADEKNAAVISEYVPGSRERLEGALEVLLESGIETAFLISGDKQTSGLSWILLHRKMTDAEFGEFKTAFLKESGGAGGGRAPLWRGRLDGDPEGILKAFTKWIET